MAITNSDLALRIATLVDRWNTRENQLILMLTQPAGNVTVTDGLEQNHSLPSFPQLQLEVTQLVSDAAGGVAAAAGHANVALQHRNAASVYADAAQTSAEDAATALEDFQADADAILAAAVVERVAAAASATAAAASATAAAGSATTASTHAGTANTHKNAAAASATAASTSETSAGTSATAASNQAGIASAAKVAAEDARDKAELWANAPLNTVVENGEYSAKHYASQAQAAVLGSLVYMGTWDAATGSYPAGAQKGHFYKVVGPGTVNGVVFNDGDQIVHNGTGWDKIDNTDSVTTVAGKSGAVTLVAGDIGGLGALATRSDADWTTHISGKPETFTPSAHNHAAADINSGTFANARIAVGNVTQHQASLSLSWSQILPAGLPTTLAGYGITDAFSSGGGTITGAVTSTNGVLRLQGYSGGSEAAVLYLGSADRWLYKQQGVDSFQFKFGPGTPATLNTGGVIWTSASFDPATKLNARGSLGTAATQSFTDWNTATENGWYMQSAAANAPKTGWLICKVTQHNAAWIQQEAWDFTAAAYTPRWRRHCNNGSWGAWTQDLFVGTYAFTGNWPTNAAYSGLFNANGMYMVMSDTSGTTFVGSSGDLTLRAAGNDATKQLQLRASDGAVVVTNTCIANAFQPINSNGAYLSGNGGGVQCTGQYYVHGTSYLVWANGANWVRQPRIFVGGADPGAAAADGDIWIP